jgi:asparagine synthase (glutamine-hydrolysing)
MCGIAGIFAYRDAGSPVDLSELRQIRDHMVKRGPDGSGEWLSDDCRIGLGHRRLAIIDLSERGRQPMHSADRQVVITFNGEIYNYRALRSGLESQGYVFQTQSDTEVLLQLYAAKGAAMVEDLRGMFAFAIWDANKRGLLLARDPFGIKPLYYADNGHTLRVASQVKALLHGGAVSREPDAAGWVGFHLFGSVPEPLTVYRDIRALPAGATLWIDAEGPHDAVPYFRVAEIYRDAEAQTPPAAVERRDRARAALLDSVRHHMVSDVPVGIFLSAGIDSGALLGLMREEGNDVHAITLAYEEFKAAHEDEAPLAARCAQRYGGRHTVRVVTETEFRQDLPHIFAAMDQPTIDGINTWFVSKAASEQGLKAAISGLGGDELFGGYPSFHTIPRWVRLLAGPSRIPFLGETFRRIACNFGLSNFLNPKAAGLLKYGGGYPGAYFLQRGLFMPWELATVMRSDFVTEGLRRFDPLRYISAAIDPPPRTPFAKVAALETSLYMRNQLLRDTDWASMAHSIEVRVPLVDAQLLRSIAPMTVNISKGARKRLLAESPHRPLPDEIVHRRKTGFGTPVREWLKRDEQLQAWQNVPQLAQHRCPWARRWAYQAAAA